MPGAPAGDPVVAAATASPLRRLTRWLAALVSYRAGLLAGHATTRTTLADGGSGSAAPEGELPVDQRYEILRSDARSVIVHDRETDEYFRFDVDPITGGPTFFKWGGSEPVPALPAWKENSVLPVAVGGMALGVAIALVGVKVATSFVGFLVFAVAALAVVALTIALLDWLTTPDEPDATEGSAGDEGTDPGASANGEAGPTEDEGGDGDEGGEDEGNDEDDGEDEDDAEDEDDDGEDGEGENDGEDEQGDPEDEGRPVPEADEPVTLPVDLIGWLVARGIIVIRTEPAPGDVDPPPDRDEEPTPTVADIGVRGDEGDIDPVPGMLEPDKGTEINPDLLDPGVIDPSD